MKTSPLFVSTLTALLLASQSVSAESLFRPRASLGFATYDLSADQGQTQLNKSTYMSLGVGATLAINSFYMDIASTQSLGAEYDNEDTGLTEDFARDDFAFTLGFAAKNGFSIFGGYKTGSSEYGNPFTPSSSTTMTFDTSGFFTGASFGFPLNDSSSLSISGALAFLDGELKDNDIGSGTPYNAEANSFGLSLAMTYTANFTDTSGLTLKGGIQSYSFVDWEDPNYFIDDMNETILAMELGFFIGF